MTIKPASIIGSCIVWLMVYFITDCVEKQQSDVVIINLSCEYNASPLGLETDTPRFSWMLTSDELGQRQTAFQILVADDSLLLARGKGNMWDSSR